MKHDFKCYSLNALDKIQNVKTIHYKNWILKDDISHLSNSEKNSWKKIISSIATTENLENLIMTELLKPFNGKAENYLQSHKQDEERHHEILQNYLLNTFHYKKSKKSFSDIIIYDYLLKYFSKMFYKWPLSFAFF